MRREWRRGRLSLRGALVVAVVLPLIGALGAASWVGLRALERQTEERLQDDIELIARAVRLPLGRALERGRASDVRDALRSVFSINRVYSAYVYDARGDLMASAGREDPAPERGRLAELAARDVRTGEYDRVGRREVYSYFLPLRGTGHQNIGLLQVTRRRSEIRASLDRVRRQAIGLLVVGALVMTGLVLYGHRGAVGRHLDRLARTMRRVEGGDRAARATIRGPSEIASVGRSLNGMLDSMARAEREIRERRTTQRALEGRLRDARRLAAVGRLAAGVAHELGTPLSVIQGNAQRLLRRSDMAEETEPALRAMRDAVGRMERIVRQLLEFGRRGGLERRSVSAREIAHAAMAAVRGEAERHDVRLAVSGEEPAPELHADRLRLEEAMVHLLRNAIQATPGGRADLTWFADADETGFQVDDDGPGIDPDARPRVFEPFFTTKRIGEGTGLGLAVVHGVVEAHGGRVEVGEAARGGARFRVVLPRAADEADGSPESDGGGDAEEG